MKHALLIASVLILLAMAYAVMSVEDADPRLEWREHQGGL